MFEDEILGLFDFPNAPEILHFLGGVFPVLAPPNETSNSEDRGLRALSARLLVSEFIRTGPNRGELA